MTERGVRAQRAGREIVFRIERDWAELLGREDFDAMIDLLGRLHDALWPEGGDSPRYAGPSQPVRGDRDHELAAVDRDLGAVGVRLVGDAASPASRR